MRLVNHASQLVHQIYQREKVEDVMQWRDAVKFPIAKANMFPPVELSTNPLHLEQRLQ
jgi:hypothetical protein